MPNKGLDRFLEAQAADYDKALGEIKNGRKQSHWMWYIFPQLAGLGKSGTSRFYGIMNAEEAKEYLAHPVLGARLVEISTTLLTLTNSNSTHIFGTPDDLKLRSCMTLFGEIPGAPIVFERVLAKFFHGKKDEQTLALLQSP